MKTIDALRAELKRTQDMIRLLNSVEVEAITTSNEELVETAYTLDQANDQLRKLATEMTYACERLQMVIVQRMLQSDSSVLLGKTCKAIYHPTKWYKVPSSRRSNPENFDKVLTSMGIPKEIAENECVRIHGPGFATYYGNREPPDGIDSKNISETRLGCKFQSLT